MDSSYKACNSYGSAVMCVALQWHQTGMNGSGCVVCIHDMCGSSTSLSSSVPLGHLYLVFPTCLVSFHHLWHSTPDPMHFWKSMYVWVLFFFFLFPRVPVTDTHHIWTYMFTLRLIHGLSYTHTHTQSGQGFVWRTHRQAHIQASLLSELSCLSLICLWSGYRQLDAALAEERSSEKHQWAEAWHSPTSTHTHIYAVNTCLLSCGDGKEQQKKLSSRA